ncbi:MAG: hypothetical protein R3Y68_00090 [Rikenellaceae bacterium]
MVGKIMGCESLLASYASEIGYDVQMGSNWNTKLMYDGRKYLLVKAASVSEKVGESRGRITFEVSFIALKCCSYSSVVVISDLWRDLRCDAMKILNMLEMSGEVLGCSEVAIEPLTKRISNYDEVAVELTATVVANYRVEDGAISIL